MLRTFLWMGMWQKGESDFFHKNVTDNEFDGGELGKSNTQPILWKKVRENWEMSVMVSLMGGIVQTGSKD